MDHASRASHDVFISYSNKDSHLASQVCAALETAGLRCWIAPRDIPKGTLWPEAITTALEQCQVVVLIFTANSNASPDVLNEIALATENDSARIVFQAEAVPPSKSLKYYLHVVQWLDATAPPLKPHLRELVEAVRQALAAHPAAPQPAAEPPAAEPPPPKKASPEPRPPKAALWLAQHARNALRTLGMLALGGIILLAVMLARGNGVQVAPTATAELTAPPTLATATAALPEKPAPPPCVNVDQANGWLSPSDGMGLLCVPEGTFLMGLPAGHPQSRGDDSPQVSVFVSAFWVDKTEITTAMFARFLNESQIKPSEGDASAPPWLGFFGNYQRLRWEQDRWLVEAGFENHPVVQVSWYGAKSYCEWAGRRLLTEAEWEKAARGVDGRLYPWGNEPPTCDLVNFNHCVPDTGTSPVDKHSGSSPFGGADFTGNVWEWVADWVGASYADLIANPKDPKGPPSGSAKIFRGGSWMNTASESVVTFRDKEKPEFVDPSVGFRCGY